MFLKISYLQINLEKTLLFFYVLMSIGEGGEVYKTAILHMLLRWVFLFILF